MEYLGSGHDMECLAPNYQNKVLTLFVHVKMSLMVTIIYIHFKVLLKSYCIALSIWIVQNQKEQNRMSATEFGISEQKLVQDWYKFGKEDFKQSIPKEGELHSQLLGLRQDGCIITHTTIYLNSKHHIMHQSICRLVYSFHHSLICLFESGMKRQYTSQMDSCHICDYKTSIYGNYLIVCNWYWTEKHVCTV